MSEQKQNSNRHRITRKPTNSYVPLGLMRVSPAGKGQRRFNQSWSDELLANFDLDALGKPVVNKRGGVYYIVDGQHRIDALKRWLGNGNDRQKIECEVYEGLSEQEEAALFDRANNTRAVNTFDRFRNRVTAGYEIETDISRIVEEEHLVITAERVEGRIMAVGTLRKIYVRTGRDTLRRTLQIVRDAFGDAGLDGPVIDGIAHLCQRYEDLLDDQSAIDRLSSAHGGVSGLLAKAELLRKQTGNSKAQCIAAAAVDIINQKRRGRKLPSWWKTADPASA